jgi:hypothetical protein
MHDILPVEKYRTTTRAQFIRGATRRCSQNRRNSHMKKRSAKNAEIVAYSIRSLLFSQGFGKTLEYFCTFSVFSVLSAD